MLKQSHHQLVSRSLSLAILAIPLIVAVLAAAPGGGGCGTARM